MIHQRTPTVSALDVAAGCLNSTVPCFCSDLRLSLYFLKHTAPSGWVSGTPTMQPSIFCRVFAGIIQHLDWSMHHTTEADLKAESPSCLTDCNTHHLNLNISMAPLQPQARVHAFKRHPKQPFDHLSTAFTASTRSSKVMQAAHAAALSSAGVPAGGQRAEDPWQCGGCRHHP